LEVKYNIPVREWEDEENYTLMRGQYLFSFATEGRRRMRLPRMRKRRKIYTRMRTTLVQRAAMAMAMSYEIMLKLNSLVTIPIELFYAINLILFVLLQYNKWSIKQTTTTLSNMFLLCIPRGIIRRLVACRFPNATTALAIPYPSTVPIPMAVPHWPQH